jgi:hypothetical protein
MTAGKPPEEIENEKKSFDVDRRIRAFGFDGVPVRYGGK